jgi:hypothetical protein
MDGKTMCKALAVNYAVLPEVSSFLRNTTVSKGRVTNNLVGK